MRAKEFLVDGVLNELGKTDKYKKPVGMMELIKFQNVATHQQKVDMKELIKAGKNDLAWKLLQAVTNTKLEETEVDEAEENTPRSKEIVKTLKKAGYKMLGSGADATVWVKEQGTVIKIIMPEDQGNTATETFKKFYEFCMQHQDIACLPKFVNIGGRAYTHFNIQGKQYTQVAMEQLYPIKRDTFEEAMVWFLGDLATQKRSWKDTKDFLSEPDPWDHTDFYRYADDFANRVHNMNEKENASYELLYTVMTLLYSTGRLNNLGWDLHTENVMQRRDGTLVIVDPWFESEL